MSATPEESARATQVARSEVVFPTEEVRENFWAIWEAQDAEAAKAAAAETKP